MGGHGALICHLKNPGKYTSVSAFGPICNPTAVPWGEKAFSGLLVNSGVNRIFILSSTSLKKNLIGSEILNS